LEIAIPCKFLTRRLKQPGRAILRDFDMVLYIQDYYVSSIYNRTLKWNNGESHNMLDLFRIPDAGLLKNSTRLEEDLPVHFLNIFTFYKSLNC
jgi:hypothetical protein